jgi:hypothetical protein
MTVVMASLTILVSLCIKNLSKNKKVVETFYDKVIPAVIVTYLLLLLILFVI